MTGPLTKAADNTHLFCLNLIYASACSMTVQAWQALEKAPKTPQNESDVKFYLETLFLKPLEENV
jgi:hypothetical protein|tara:strand:- start:659 stop:853 length:195 start_codon:yes stop_codon:yes gene_type:complete